MSKIFINLELHFWGYNIFSWETVFADDAAYLEAFEVLSDGKIVDPTCEKEQEILKERKKVAARKKRDDTAMKKKTSRNLEAEISKEVGLADLVEAGTSQPSGKESDEKSRHQSRSRSRSRSDSHSRVVPTHSQREPRRSRSPARDGSRSHSRSGLEPRSRVAPNHLQRELRGRPRSTTPEDPQHRSRSRSESRSRVAQNRLQREPRRRSRSPSRHRSRSRSMQIGRSRSNTPAPRNGRRIDDNVGRRIDVNAQIARRIDDNAQIASCRENGPGRVRLAAKYEVYADKSELDYLMRWWRNPKQMLRSLFKMFIGEEALKNMSAKGTKRRNCYNRPAIPADIYSAVEGECPAINTVISSVLPDFCSYS